MKTKRYLIFIIPIFLIGMFSCEYDNSGVYEPKVNNNIAPPEIQTINLNLDEDTLYLYGSKNVNFNFRSNDVQKIVAVSFYIDNSYAATVNSNKGTFQIDFYALTEGFHKLNIQIYTHTGTGSIADKLDAEYFALSSKDWIIKVERVPNYPNAIQTYSSDGFLRLTWPKCYSVDFKEYQIKKNSLNDLIAITTKTDVVDSFYIGEYESYTVNVITKAGNVRYWARGEKLSEFSNIINQSVENGMLKLSWPNINYPNLKEFEIFKDGSSYYKNKSNEFIDSIYIGEGEDYSLRVFSKNGSYYDIAQIRLSKESSGFVVQGIDKEQSIAKWEKSKYFNAIKSYELYQKINGYYTMVKTTNNINDTSYNINNAFFGDDVNLIFKYVPKVSYHYNYFSVNYDNIKGFTFTTNTNPVWNFKVSGSSEFIFSQNYELVKYSTVIKNKTNQILSSYYLLNQSTEISPSKNYIVTHISDKLTLVKSRDFTFEIIQYPELLNGQYNLTNIPISDVKTGILNYYNNNGFCIFDFNNKSIIAKFEAQNSNLIKGLKISQNGDFIYLQKDDSLKFVQLNGSSFITIFGKKYTESDLCFLDFDPLDPNRLAYSDGSDLYVKYCSDFSTISEFPLTGELLLNIDFYNNEFLTFKTSHLYVRNFLDGSVIKDIPINFEITTNSNMCYLINHTIVYPEKRIMYFVN